MGVLSSLRCLVNHGVGVVDAVTVGAPMFSENIEQFVVVLTVGPIALKLEHCGYGGHRDCPGLYTTPYSRFVGKRGCRPTGVLDNVNVVSLSKHVEGRPGDTHLGP